MKAVLLIALMLIFPANALGECLTLKHKTASVNRHNVLTSQVKLRPVTETTTVSVDVDTFRGSQLEYHDRATTELSGPVFAAQTEQLPLSWKSVRLRVRYTIVTPNCKPLVIWLSVRTAKHPKARKA